MILVAQNSLFSSVKMKLILEWSLLDNEINSSSVEKESIERKLNFSSGKKNDNNNSVKSKD